MIKNSLFAAVLLSSALIQTDANAGFLDIFSRNNSKVHSEAVKDVYSGLKFNYLDQEDRLLIVNDFLKTVELEYALLPLKIERIGLDFKKLKSEAIAAEMLETDITLAAEDKKDEYAREKIAFLQANSNMDFMDRMQALVASFKDTHFGIQEKINRPIIYSGLRLYRLQGKIYVGSIERKFLSLAGKGSGTDFSDIKIGDEVLAIDGVPVEKKIEDLKKYIAGSSEQYVDSNAVLALTIRNFKYEKKNFVTFTFRNAGIYKLPIFANKAMTATARLDAITYFNKYKIPSDTTAIGLTYDKPTNKWNDSALTFDGYSPRKLHLNLKGMTEYAGADGTPAIRTGYYISKGKTYGVLQLLTFYSPTAQNGTTTIPFLDAVRNFILELKENESPLIIDMRLNGGGYGNYPAAVLSMLAEQGTVYPGSTTGLRMTHFIRQIYEPELYKEIMGEDQTIGATADEIQNIISDTLDKHLDYAPMFANSPIMPDPIVRGFSNKVVALVTPDCISACDMMSFLLKESKRATIIGTNSNGTGAGFISTEAISASWEDPLKMFTAQVPNNLFGRPGPTAAVNIFEEGSVSKLCSENKATVADIQYSPTVIDFAKNSVGWLQKATEVLETPK
jgi:C-terminal processing protease CtpA/Prc